VGTNFLIVEGEILALKKLMYYQYGQHCIFGAKFYPEIFKRGILFIGSPGTSADIIETKAPEPVY